MSLMKKRSDIVAEYRSAIERHLRYSLGRKREDATPSDILNAVSLAVRDPLIDAWIETQARYDQADAKRLYYLSMEYLIGRSLGNNLCNLGIFDLCASALQQLGYDLSDILEVEPDAALGNGGLGRLAACFLDSLATLGMPGYGYGINYEFGLFKQVIENGYQKEYPDHWRAYGSPWTIEYPHESCKVPVYGFLERGLAPSGPFEAQWVKPRILIGVPHDMPIVGYGGYTVNHLRLYTAQASHEFDMEIFNQGDYIKAVEQKILSETISKVLYPSDSVLSGKELRLLQEYFLVSCALQDILRRYRKRYSSFDVFPEKVAVQLNDTHPALAVAELMRLFVDEHALSWDTAWDLTRRTLAFTNHTLLPEALETWSLTLFERVLPHHLQIIYKINERFLGEVAHIWPDKPEVLPRMSIVSGNGGDRIIRMAHLAIVGSHSVNGVARLHSELVKTKLVPDFYALWPEKFNNKTNGVTQRRWLLKANPRLAGLISRTIGDRWITDLEKLRELETYANDLEIQTEFTSIKRMNKMRLARVVQETTGISIDPSSLFDIQVKRIHEYKRQLLNIMQIIHRYLSIVEDGWEPEVPRTCIFAGKAAPGYWEAKQIIKLINAVAERINNDPRANEFLRVVFIPDYRVSLAEKIIPAADLSEQISTAGKEASGTGNMKFAMNGALTMGTLDGANIEIREEVGVENIFIFGLTAEEIERMRAENAYDPKRFYEQDERIRRVVDTFSCNFFAPDEPGIFTWIKEKLLQGGDPYFHLADLGAYIEIQQAADDLYLDPKTWYRKA
ncbi:MAG: glycogen/starch/alpha-glucan phosphorylase, partial [Deltaproteobacteria bacterium]